MKVIICGGRDYHLSDVDRQFLTHLHEQWHFSLVLSGGATGADTDGESWADAVPIPVKRFPVSKADWDTYGRAAGPLRNKAMVDVCAAEPAGMVVAFPGGAGTRNCRKLARLSGLTVICIGDKETTP